jgi:hypothetical protein
VVVSLFAYFFTMIMALSAIAALLTGLFNNSATESVLHYPHPQRAIIDQTFTTTSPQRQDLPDAPRIKKEKVPAKKDKPDKNINDSRVLFAKADTAKRKLEITNKPERLAHLNKSKGLAPQREKLKVLARQHNIYERPGYYGNTMGYAQETQYGPQRPFSNWWLTASHSRHGADMTPETDENGSDSGAPRNTQAASPTAGAGQIPNDVGSRDEVQPAPPITPAARGRNDALWAGLATTVAVAAMLWIAYQSNARNEVAQVQKQVEALHADLQSLKDKIQRMTAAQSPTDVEQSQPSISEIRGLQNHVETLRGQAKRQKK